MVDESAGTKVEALRATQLFRRTQGAEDVLATLAAASRIESYDPQIRSSREERFLLWPGQPAGDVFFIASGFVQLCTGHPEFGQPFDEPGLHLDLLHDGDLVGDAELILIAAAATADVPAVPKLPPRTLSAVVLRGGATTVLRTPVEALAAAVSAVPSARQRLALAVAARYSGLARALAASGLGAQRARPRVARLLTELFDRMGEGLPADDGSGRIFERLARPLTNGDLARSLGLTARSVQDDVEALEACGVLGDDGTGRLVLREPQILRLIAGEAAPPEHEVADEEDEAVTAAERRADAWRRAIEARMDEAPAAAASLAEEAVYAFPVVAPRRAANRAPRPRGAPDGARVEARTRDPEVGIELPKDLRLREQAGRLQAAKLRVHYQAVLAQLRAGAAPRAQAWLNGALTEWAELLRAEQDAFYDVPGTDRLREDLRAANARLSKERAFAEADAGRRRELLSEAGHAYRQVFLDGGSHYTAVNAATLLRMTGSEEMAGELAVAALEGARRERPRGYWSLATEAEALWLLGRRDAAVRAARAARGCPDCSNAKLQSTRLQLRRLQAFLPAFPELLHALEPDAVLVIADPASASAWDPEATARLAAAARGLCVLTTTDAAAVALGLGAEASKRVRMVPIATDATPQARTAAARLALGLGALSAAALEAPLRLTSNPRQADGPVHTFSSCTPLRLEGRPTWAAEDLAGRIAILWLTRDDRQQRGGAVTIPQRHQLIYHGRSEDEHVLAGTMSDILACASALVGAGSADGVRLCLDVVPLSADRLDLTSLPVASPRAASSVLYATDEAAAELALLGRDDLLVRSVGRVRVSRLRGSNPLWAVERIAPLPSAALQDRPAVDPALSC